jgi:hypothetical protein
MPSTRLKMAVVALMPSASVSTTVRVKAGLRRHWRSAKVRSWRRVGSMTRLLQEMSTDAK